MTDRDGTLEAGVRAVALFVFGATLAAEMFYWSWNDPTLLQWGSSILGGLLFLGLWTAVERDAVSAVTAYVPLLLAGVPTYAVLYFGVAEGLLTAPGTRIAAYGAVIVGIVVAIVVAGAGGED